MKDIMSRINSYRKCIQPRYSLTVGECTAIIKGSGGVCEIASNAYDFGYIRGMKAARAELRKKEKCNG